MAVEGEAPLIRLEGVGKTYGTIEVLRDVTVDIGAGEVVALAGENGAGKSTVLSIITGLIAPTTGKVSLNGDILPVGWTPAAAREAGIASVQQELSLNPHQSIAENIFMGAWPARWGLVHGRDIDRRAAELLSRVGVDRDPRTPVRRLALAERQLVEIAKALAVRPRLLVLDEATSSLDDGQVARVFDVVRDLTGSGTSTIVVTHRMSEMFAICDRFVILKDGALVDVRQRDETDEDGLVTAMLGRTMSQLFPDRSGGSSPERGGGMRVRGLDVGTVQGLDLEVPAGSITGLGGLQGQGQRDVLRALFGLKPHRGTIEVDGRKIAVGSPRAAIAHHIAYVPEDRKDEGVLVEQSVGRNLELPNLRTLAPWTKLSTVSRRAAAELTASMIAALQIKATPGQITRRLSGGNQQKVSLAKWLPTRPHVLLLAEPTRGIDIGTKREIYRLLREFADSGMAILLTSGDTLELIGLCDRVHVMYEGRIVDSLSEEDLTEERLVEASVTGTGGVVA